MVFTARAAGRASQRGRGRRFRRLATTSPRAASALGELPNAAPGSRLPAVAAQRVASGCRDPLPTRKGCGERHRGVGRRSATTEAAVSSRKRRQLVNRRRGRAGRRIDRSSRVTSPDYAGEGRTASSPEVDEPCLAVARLELLEKVVFNFARRYQGDWVLSPEAPD